MLNTVQSVGADSKNSVDIRKNALNTLKVLAALQVAYFHIITHLNIKVPDIVTKVASLFMGVPIFFVLSGFLIWNSLEKHKSFKDYAIKRTVRIYPELWLGVAVELLAIIILLDGAIDWLMFTLFAITQSTIFQFWTPDFLRNFGCGTPNGALWTLCITIQFYILVWFIHKILSKKNIKWWICSLGISVIIKAVSPFISDLLPGVISKLYGVTILPHLWMFMFGAFLAHYKDKAIPFLKKTWYVFILLSIVIGWLKFDIGVESYGVLTYTLRLAGLIGLCYNIPKLNIPLDFSYSLFIYHMIVVNVMIELGFTGEIYHLIIALAISLAISVLSTLFGKTVIAFMESRKIERKENANQT